MEIKRSTTATTTTTTTTNANNDISFLNYSLCCFLFLCYSCQRRVRAQNSSQLHQSLKTSKRMTLTMKPSPAV